MSKTAEAFRTISEVAGELDVPKHVLRFWEGKFPQIKPMKRGGGRRYYRPEDMALLRGICHLLRAEGYTIKGVQKILREQGVDQVKNIAAPVAHAPVTAKADPVAEKRTTRRPTATKVSAGRRAVSRDSTVLTSDHRARIEAAIAELQTCRNLLLGKAIESAARRRTKTRRAARP